MTVRLRLSAMLLALALGALSAFAVACGEERTGLISASRADSIRNDLDAIDEAVRAGRCAAADGRLASLRKEVQDLPGSVDADLRRELRDGVTRLEEQAPEECELGTETTETTTTETEPPVETTETVPAPVETTETAPQTTPQTTPQPTTPQPTTPAPEPEPDPGAEPAPEPDVPSDPGGEEAPGGVIE